jgi:hypothetical protein
MCNGTSSQSNPVDHEKYFKQLLRSLRKQVVRDIDVSFQQIHQQMQEKLHANAHPVGQPATLNVVTVEDAQWGTEWSLEEVEDAETPKAVANGAFANGISNGSHVNGTHFEMESFPSRGSSIRSNNWADMLGRKRMSQKNQKR